MRRRCLLVMLLVSAAIPLACSSRDEEGAASPVRPASPCAPAREANAPGSGSFGCWVTDASGLPAYEYTLEERDPRRSFFTTRDTDGSNDQYHQVGNLRIKGMAHVDGRVRFLDGTRGQKWVSEYSESTLTIAGTAIPQGARRLVFGMGYVRTIAEHAGVRATRTVFAPQGARADDPILFVEHVIANESSEARAVEVAELWDATMHPLSLALSYAITPEAAEQERRKLMQRFEQVVSYDRDRGALLVDTRPASGVSLPPRTEAADADFYPGTLALALLGDMPDRYAFTKRTSCDGCTPRTWSTVGRATARIGPPPYGLANPQGATNAGPLPAAGDQAEDGTEPGSPFALELARAVRVAPGETKRIVFAVAYDDDAKIGPLLERLRVEPAPRSEDALAEIDKQGPRLVLDGPSSFDAALARELRWHGYYLLSSANFEEYYGVHNIDQGAAYGYLMGLRGAARDTLINAVAATHLSPRLAREILEYVLATSTSSDAKIPYATCNFGQTSDAIVHKKPTDLDLWFLWALVEYVTATRDFAFLDARVAYYPVTAGASGTVRARVARSLDWLLDVVGVGDHGMFLVGTGDWNDGIRYLAKDAATLEAKGESAFTTAFAAYVFPRVAELLDASDPALATRYRKAGERFATVMAAQYNGKWFHRAWDGAGSPLGDDRIFLEHHTWLLAGDALPPEQRASVIASIDGELSARSPIGTLIVFPSVPNPLLAPGWDVNGGTWAAMNGLLTWGLAKTDAARGWKELADNSMARHADVYPDVWYGIWSGPDSYNAPYAERPGEAARHAATPLTDFPITDSNRHALPIVDLVKLAGLEYDAKGLVLRPHMPFPTFAVETPLASVKYAADAVEGRTEFQTAGRVDVALPTGIDAGTSAAVTVNGVPVALQSTERTVSFDVPAGTARWRVARR